MIRVELAFEWSNYRRATEHLNARVGAVQATIERLGLNKPTYCEARAAYHDQCLGLGGAEPLGSKWLERESPFVAAEMKRQSLMGEMAC